MLTEKEVEKIAELARIKLTKKEKEKFRTDLSSILDYFNELNQVNTESAKPLYQTTGINNSFREDVYRNDFKLGEDLYSKLIGQAPHKEDNLVKVKSILNSDDE